jgi:hypothetical protein
MYRAYSGFHDESIGRLKSESDLKQENSTNYENDSEKFLLKGFNKLDLSILRG